MSGTVLSREVLKPPLTRRLRWEMAARRQTLNRVARLTAPHVALTAVETAALMRLRADGFAVIPAAEFEWPLLPALEREFWAFHAAASSQEGWRIRAVPTGAAVDPASPVVRMGLDAVKRIADAFYGLPARLLYPDLWVVRPGAPDRERRASQVWHRDPEDIPILKVFLYFSAVTPEAGPLEYVPASRHRRAYEVPPAGTDIVRVTCPAMSVALFDASALHRGGYALSTERHSATWAYVTPASRYPSTFAVQP